MKQLSNELKNKINSYIKNKIDISDLLIGYDIKGLDLSNSVISNFNRINEDLSNTNFAGATIGIEGKITNLSNNNFQHCNFRGTRFLGKIFMRRCDCRNASFAEAFLPYVEYQYSDFRGCKFCATTLTIGSREGLKAKFSKELFTELIKYWDIEGVKTTNQLMEE